MRHIAVREASKLTAGAVFVLSDPAHAVTRESPMVIREVTAHPHSITLSYYPTVLGWLRIPTSDCCIHIYIYNWLMNAFNPVKTCTQQEAQLSLKGRSYGIRRME